GEYIGELLTWLAKKGPAAGIVLVLATQRPDSRTIPSGLRAVMGSRFALRVMDWRDSNIVLGEQMNTRGYDSSRLLPTTELASRAQTATPPPAGTRSPSPCAPTTCPTTTGTPSAHAAERYEKPPAP